MELKAAILFKHKDPKSILWYSKALEILPNSADLLLSKALVQLYLPKSSNSKNYYHNLETDLQSVLKLEPKNLLAHYFLSVYYRRINKQADSLLETAIMAYKMNQKQKAISLAIESLKQLPSNSRKRNIAEAIINRKS